MGLGVFLGEFISGEKKDSQPWICSETSVLIGSGNSHILVSSPYLSPDLDIMKSCFDLWKGEEEGVDRHGSVHNY
jgi:hypothetical protein